MTEQKAIVSDPLSLMPRPTLTVLALLLLVLSASIHAADPPLPLADRLELFVDRHLIDSTEGVTLTMGQPRAEEISITFENPWEGGASGANPTVIVS